MVADSRMLKRTIEIIRHDGSIGYGITGNVRNPMKSLGVKLLIRRSWV
jgi:hypothetical protein